MPATSKAQQALMALAAHGAKFAKAKQLRQHMSHAQLEDFAKTPTKKLPAHVRATKPQPMNEADGRVKKRTSDVTSAHYEPPSPRRAM